MFLEIAQKRGISALRISGVLTRPPQRVLNSRLEEKTLRENGTNMIGLSFTGVGGFTGDKEVRADRRSYLR